MASLFSRDSLDINDYTLELRSREVRLRKMKWTEIATLRRREAEKARKLEARLMRRNQPYCYEHRYSTRGKTTHIKALSNNFQTLPFEIRDKIFRYIIVDQIKDITDALHFGPGQAHNPFGQADSVRPRDVNLLTILRPNAELYDQALTVFYRLGHPLVVDRLDWHDIKNSSSHVCAAVTVIHAIIRFTPTDFEVRRRHTLTPNDMRDMCSFAAGENMRRMEFPNVRKFRTFYNLDSFHDALIDRRAPYRRLDHLPHWQHPANCPKLARVSLWLPNYPDASFTYKKWISEEIKLRNELYGLSSREKLSWHHLFKNRWDWTVRVAPPVV